MLLCSSALALAETGTQADRQDLGALSRQAEQWLQKALQAAGQDALETVSVQAGELDPRLQLSSCRQAISIDFAPGQGLRAKTNLRLQCPDKPGWRLFLPMSIRRQALVWVARNSVASGSTLQAAQWQRERRDVAGLPASPVTTDTLDGYQARQPIGAGTVLTQALISGRTVVKRGQMLTLTANQGGIAISTVVEAVDSGAAGERIRVRNPGSGRLIDAEIVNSEQVRVP